MSYRQEGIAGFDTAGALIGAVVGSVLVAVVLVLVISAKWVLNPVKKRLASMRNGSLEPDMKPNELEFYVPPTPTDEIKVVEVEQTVETALADAVEEARSEEVREDFDSIPVETDESWREVMEASVVPSAVSLPIRPKAITPRLKQQADPVQTHSGVLMFHGLAERPGKDGPYQSYCVRIYDAASGGEHALWGVDLDRARKEACVKVGDHIAISLMGRSPVALPNGKTSKKNVYSIVKSAA